MSMQDTNMQSFLMYIVYTKQGFRIRFTVIVFSFFKWLWWAPKHLYGTVWNRSFLVSWTGLAWKPHVRTGPTSQFREFWPSWNYLAQNSLLSRKNPNFPTSEKSIDEGPIIMTGSWDLYQTIPQTYVQVPI